MKSEPTVAKTIKLSPELWAALAELAEREHRSMTAQVRHLVQQAVARG